jgi:hypothetical protein
MSEQAKADMWDIEELIAFGHSVHTDQFEYRGKMISIYWHEILASEMPNVRNYKPEGESDLEMKADMALHVLQEKAWAMIEKGQRLAEKPILSKIQFESLPEGLRNEIVSTLLDLRKKMQASFLDGPTSPSKP